MFELTEETNEKLQSGKLISSRMVKDSAALLPAAFGTTNENARCKERIRKAGVPYIEPLSIFVNV